MVSLLLRLFALISILVISTTQAASLSGKVSSYTDGDTLQVWNQKIRLVGIYAPEMSQTCEDGGNKYQCGDLAANHLQKVIGDKEVRCEGDSMTIIAY